MLRFTFDTKKNPNELDNHHDPLTNEVINSSINASSVQPLDMASFITNIIAQSNADQTLLQEIESLKSSIFSRDHTVGEKLNAWNENEPLKNYIMGLSDYLSFSPPVSDKLIRNFIMLLNTKCPKIYEEIWTKNHELKTYIEQSSYNEPINDLVIAILRTSPTASSKFITKLLSLIKCDVLIKVYEGLPNELNSHQVQRNSLKKFILNKDPNWKCPSLDNDQSLSKSLSAKKRSRELTIQPEEEPTHTMILKHNNQLKKFVGELILSDNKSAKIEIWHREESLAPVLMGIDPKNPLNIANPEMAMQLIKNFIILLQIEVPEFYIEMYYKNSSNLEKALQKLNDESLALKLIDLLLQAPMKDFSIPLLQNIKIDFLSKSKNKFQQCELFLETIHDNLSKKIMDTIDLDEQSGLNTPPKKIKFNQGLMDNSFFNYISTNELNYPPTNIHTTIGSTFNETIETKVMEEIIDLDELDFEIRKLINDKRL